MNLTRASAQLCDKSDIKKQPKEMLSSNLSVVLQKDRVIFDRLQTKCRKLKIRASFTFFTSQQAAKQGATPERETSNFVLSAVFGLVSVS